MSSMHIEFAPADFNDWSALLALLQTSFAYMDGAHRSALVTE